MLSKLAIRNTKRQVGNYSIYFVTVMVTVALIFAVNSVIYSDQITFLSAISVETRKALTVFSAFIASIIAFVLGYATTFMIRLRKREFGTYLILGMSRGNILKIFVIETLTLSIVALALGIFLGLFLYQGMMAVISAVLDISTGFASYSSKGLWLTILTVLLIFALSSATSAIYLGKVRIHELIYNENKVTREIKHPEFWLFISIMSFCGIVFSFLLFDTGAQETFNIGADGERKMFVAIALAAVAVFLFHFSAARSLANVLLKKTQYKLKGMNTFLLRQISSRLNTNSAIMGILSFLFAFTVIFLSIVIVQKVGTDAALQRDCPFDVIGIVDPMDQEAISPTEGVDIISEYAEIEYVLYYQLFDSGKNDIYSCTPWSGEGYEGLNDVYICESDYNSLMERLGLNTIDCSEGFYVAVKYEEFTQFDYSRAVLNNGNRECTYAGMVTNVPFFFYGYLCVVVPDEFTDGMTIKDFSVAIDLGDSNFNEIELKNDLTYTSSYMFYDEEIQFENCDYIIKEFVRLDYNGQNAIMIVTSLYLAAVLIFMAMAILSLKTLAEVSGDKVRYSILFRLGVSRIERCRILLRQQLIFFFLPFIVPMVMGFPAVFLCVRIIKRLGYISQIGTIYSIFAVAAFALIIVYLLFFLATYLISRRNVIDTEL